MSSDLDSTSRQGVSTEHEPEDRVDMGSSISKESKADSRLSAANDDVWSVLLHMSDAACLVDVEGQIRYVNPAFESLYGYSLGDLIGPGWWGIEEIAPYRNVRDCYRRALRGEQFSEVETVALRKDGTTVDVGMSISPVRDEVGRVQSMVIISRDISFRKFTERVLQESEQQFRALIEHSADVIAILDAHGYFTYVSDASKRILGSSPHELLGKSVLDLVQPEDVGLFRNAIMDKLISKGEAIALEIAIRHASGAWLTCEVVGQNLLHDPKVHGVVMNFRDETDKRRTAEQVEYMAFHDELTGLPNRKAFDGHLRTVVARSEHTDSLFAIMYLDLDRFKFVNDTFGHHTGDELLKLVAARISTCLRKGDFVARLSGDEFAVCVENISEATDVEQVASKMVQSFGEPFVVEEYTFFVTPSIGVALYPEDGLDIGTITKRADVALYRAKDSGRNQFQLYRVKSNDSPYKDIAVRGDLHKALDSGEIGLKYEPRVAPSTGRIVGVEASAYWNHADKGVISSEDLVRIAEEAGLTVLLGKYVVSTVCSQNQVWQEGGSPKVPVSIRMSGKQLMHREMVTLVAQSLAESNLEPRWLELSIDEKTAFHNDEMVSNVIRDLKRLGVSIAMDQFGTGYASLTRMREFNFDTLKISKALVKDLGADAVGAMVVRATITLAQGLGMKVVAEGVDTFEQLNALREMGCSEVQGAVCSRPLDEKGFNSMLQWGICLLAEPEAPIRNRRRYSRVTLPHPLIAHMSVASIHHQIVEAGRRKVLIENIGPGGIRLLSDIQLPTNPDVILRVTPVAFEDLHLYGHIVWRQPSEVSDAIFLYGLELAVDETTRTDLIRKLGEVQRAGEEFSASSGFYQGDIREFFLS